MQNEGESYSKHALVAVGCATVVCRWRPGDTTVLLFTIKPGQNVGSVLFSLYHITVMSSKKKKHTRNVVQECLDRISASKKKTVKKAVSVEKPSSDDDTADRISLPQCH